MTTIPKRGLGRGFDTLIPSQLLEEEFDPTAQQDDKLSQLRHLPIADIEPDPDQPRRNFDETALEEMAGSIRVHGIVQPLVVTPLSAAQRPYQAQAKYQIVAGERRWRAAKIAGLTEVPAIIRSLSDQHKLEIALIENLQREDLNPIETATAYLKLAQQFNMTHQEIGQRAGGKATSTISNTMRLLGLPKAAKLALIEGKITEGHARQILAIQEPEIQQELLNLILKHDWTVRKTEQYVIGYKEGKKDTAAAQAKVQTETRETQALSQRLGGAQVRVRHMARGGRLEIQFRDQAELERMVSVIVGDT